VYWNGVAEAAFARAVAAGRPGQIGTLDFVMVHIAVHDAVQAFEIQASSWDSRRRSTSSISARSTGGFLRSIRGPAVRASA
jgi:hypothetical protein